MALIQQAAIGGPCGRAAQFGLGQQPQMGFRALAVHILSVLPAARSSSPAAGPVQMLAAARTNAGRQPKRPIRTPTPSLHRKGTSSLMDALAASSAPVTA